MRGHDLNQQHPEMQKGLIYVMRRINGVDVPLRIWNQSSYREWLGCFTYIGEHHENI